MQDRMTEDKPTRVPARANRWWNQPSAIGAGGTEGLTGTLGDRAKSVLLLERAPTDRRAGCGRPACPVRREGEREHALPTPIRSTCGCSPQPYPMGYGAVPGLRAYL